MKHQGWPLIASMSWAKDSSGYVIIGSHIARLGGVMVPVEPDKCPSLQKDFLDIGNITGVVGFDEDGEPIPDADFLGDLQKFVNRYGLLGLTDGPAAQQEPIEAIAQARTSLSVYLAFAHKDPSVSQAARTETFNERCPRRFRAVMEVDAGRSILKFKPESLLAWMWLQLAKEIDGGVQPHTCPGCGITFYLGEENASRHVRKRAKANPEKSGYCSPSCYAAHWKRTKRAEEKNRAEKKGASK